MKSFLSFLPAAFPMIFIGCAIAQPRRVDHEGRNPVRDLSISRALKSATGSGGVAVVFEIRRGEDVLACIENNSIEYPVCSI